QAFGLVWSVAALAAHERVRKPAEESLAERLPEQQLAAVDASRADVSHAFAPHRAVIGENLLRRHRREIVKVLVEAIDRCADAAAEVLLDADAKLQRVLGSDVRVAEVGIRVLRLWRLAVQAHTRGERRGGRKRIARGQSRIDRLLLDERVPIE